MNPRRILTAIFAMAVVTVSACSGGGPSTNAGNGPGSGGTGASTTITGVAVAGPISGGAVTAYGITNGVKGAALASSTSDSSGKYVLSLGAYTGPTLVEVTGGTYKDEATGITVALPATLRAVVANASGAVTANVTSLTEAAVVNSLADTGGLTAANIQFENAVSKVQLGFDPVLTSPADASSIASATASDASKAYGAYLGVVSQYLKDNPSKSFDVATGDFAAALKSAGGALSASTLFTAAGDNFGTNPNNQTGVTSMSALLALSDKLNGSNTPVIQIMALDKTVAAPFSILTISGTGLSQPGAAVSVNFISTNGNPTIVVPVSTPTATSLQVMVPVLVDPTSGNSISDVIKVQVSQVFGSTLSTSNLVSGLQVLALPSVPPGTPIGARTAELLAAVLDMFTNAQSILASDPNLSAIAAASPNYAADLLALLSAINSVISNPSASVSLTTSNGDVVTIDAAALALSDQVAQALVAELAAGTQATAAVSAMERIGNFFIRTSYAQSSSACPMYPNDPTAYDTNLCWVKRTFSNLAGASPKVVDEEQKALANLVAGGLPKALVALGVVGTVPLWGEIGICVSATLAYSYLTAKRAPPGGDVVEGVTTTTLDKALNTSGMIGFAYDAFKLFRLAATTWPSQKGVAPIAMQVSDRAGNTYVLLRDGSSLVTVPTSQGAVPVDSVKLVVPPPPVCNFTYSGWSACQANNTQTRTVVSSSPPGCTGAPVLSQACTYVPPVCDPLKCYNICLSTDVSCVNACPSSPASVALSCLNACAAAFAACPSVTDPITCTCHP